MAQRKNPIALRRSRNKSNPIFCTYITKEQSLTSWINRLKRLQRTKHFIKCRLKMKLTNRAQKKSSTNKALFKLTDAVIFSSHFSNTVYPMFSKAVSFKRRNLKKNRFKKKKSLSFFIK